MSEWDLPLTVRAPAKINLHLRVGPLGPDGFHPLMSWFCTVGLVDELAFAPDPDQGSAPHVRVQNAAELGIDDRSNLIVRAAQAMRTTMSVTEQSRCFALSVHVRKKIPMGGGLGGGSSDAAATLAALNRLWNLQWPLERLSAIAATLGSDVPFFLRGPSSICTGRGEQVRPIDPPVPRFVLLILPEMAMPTPQVYRMFDQMKLGDVAAVQTQPDWKTWSRLPAKELLPLLVNDLEAPAFAVSPELSRLREETERGIGQPVRMSGSGSTLFTLFDHVLEANEAAAKLSVRGGVLECAWRF